MFQSVIEQQGWRSGKLGTGAGVSLLVHAGVLAAVLSISAKVAEAPPEPTPVLKLVARPLPPRGDPAPVVEVVPERTRPKPRQQRTLVQPTAIPPKPLEVEPPPTPEQPPEPPQDTAPGSHPEGVSKGGVPGVPFIPGLLPLNSQENPGGSGEDVLPFGSGMTPPTLLASAPLQYTREALEARVEGTLVARCVVTREGEVEGCRIIRGLPHMNEAVLASLESRRYRPVHYQGRAVSVSYTFHVRLTLPR